MIRGLTPIDIKLEEAALSYQFTNGSTKMEKDIDHDTRTKHWLHPAFSLTILEECKEDNSTIKIFTDGSKSEQRVGAGTAIFVTGTHTKSLKYRLYERCSINQAEQMAIIKSLEYIKDVHTPEKTVTVYSDSQTTLKALKNNRIHTSLIDKIR